MLGILGAINDADNGIPTGVPYQDTRGKLASRLRSAHGQAFAWLHTKLSSVREYGCDSAIAVCPAIQFHSVDSDWNSVPHLCEPDRRHGVGRDGLDYANPSWNHLSEGVAFFTCVQGCTVNHRATVFGAHEITSR